MYHRWLGVWQVLVPSHSKKAASFTPAKDFSEFFSDGAELELDGLIGVLLRSLTVKWEQTSGGASSVFLTSPKFSRNGTQFQEIQSQHVVDIDLVVFSKSIYLSFEIRIASFRGLRKVSSQGSEPDVSVKRLQFDYWRPSMLYSWSLSSMSFSYCIRYVMLFDIQKGKECAFWSRYTRYFLYHLSN